MAKSPREATIDVAVGAGVRGYLHYIKYARREARTQTALTAESLGLMDHATVQRLDALDVIDPAGGVK
jgi:hypothetical protein